NEMFEAIDLIELAVGRTIEDSADEHALRARGRELLNSQESLNGKEILLDNVEFSRRKVVLAKPKEAYNVYRRMIQYYAGVKLVEALGSSSLEELKASIEGPNITRGAFENIGGQLVPAGKLARLISDIRDGSVESWAIVHDHYHAWSRSYLTDKLEHAIASLREISGVNVEQWDSAFIKDIFKQTLLTREWIFSEITSSRAKDYQNPFKLMLYESYQEMEEVVGKLADNDFINKERVALKEFQQVVQQLSEKL
ncbi:MAG: hypothetical protein ACTJHT_09655, partial [Sphingobacterium sp.]